MFTALMVAMVVTCRSYQPIPAPPPRPPAPVTVHCENGDQVQRGTWGQELSRVTRAPACTQPSTPKFGLTQR